MAQKSAQRGPESSPERVGRDTIDANAVTEAEKSISSKKKLIKNLPGFFDLDFFYFHTSEKKTDKKKLPGE